MTYHTEIRVVEDNVENEFVATIMFPIREKSQKEWTNLMNMKEEVNRPRKFYRVRLLSTLKSM